KVVGTANGIANFAPLQAGQSWGGIATQSGGSVDIAYATIDHASIPVACIAGTALCKIDHSSLQNFSSSGIQISAPASFTYVKVANGAGDGILVSTQPGQVVTITDSTFTQT